MFVLVFALVFVLVLMFMSALVLVATLLSPTSSGQALFSFGFYKCSLTVTLSIDFHCIRKFSTDFSVLRQRTEASVPIVRTLLYGTLVGRLSLRHEIWQRRQ